jgi:hypothetical protein
MISPVACPSPAVSGAGMAALRLAMAPELQSSRYLEFAWFVETPIPRALGQFWIGRHQLLNAFEFSVRGPYRFRDELWILARKPILPRMVICWCWSMAWVCPYVGIGPCKQTSLVTSPPSSKKLRCEIDIVHYPKTFDIRKAKLSPCSLTIAPSIPSKKLEFRF